MAISGKPQKNASAAEPVQAPNEQDVFNLINKGGSVAKATTPKVDTAGTKPMLVQLRLYADLVEEIDAVRNGTGGKGKRHRPPSRHAWIVSAIEEKLARDNPGT